MRWLTILLAALALPATSLACGMETSGPSLPLAELMEFVDELTAADPVEVAEVAAVPAPLENQRRQETADEAKKQALLGYRHRSAVD